jgi:hypothetical protein
LCSSQRPSLARERPPLAAAPLPSLAKPLTFSPPQRGGGAWFTDQTILVCVVAYFLDLFTPETWSAFRRHGAAVSGFRERQLTAARDRIKPGDILLCYLVRLSRWCGALEVKSHVFLDSSPIFSDPDPFIVRFNVKPLVVLDLDQSPPVLDSKVWNNLEETKGITRAVGAGQ